jgi:hypothetical protein
LPAYVLDVPFGRGKVRLMETTVRKVPNTFGQDADMEGGLWQIDLPHTRTEQGGSALYLDLAAPRVDGRTIPL